MNVRIFVDGGSRGNPGPAAAGVVIQDTDQEVIRHEGGYYLGRLTNNAAEYQGLIRALELADEIGGRSATIFSDSQLMVRQVTGAYKVKSAALKPLHDRVRDLLSGFDRWQITHVYREHNHRADELANMAMDARDDVIVTSIPVSVSGEAQGVAPNIRPQGARATAADDAPRETPDPSAVQPDPQTWTATFESPPGPACPAPAPTDSYRFGPAVPGGMCVHAAWAVLDATVNARPSSPPPLWDATRPTVACDRCGASIQIVDTAVGTKIPVNPTDKTAVSER